MNKREMANQLRKWAGQGITYKIGSETLMSDEIASEAAAALEREAAREERARPKVTLEQQQEACSDAADTERLHDIDKPAMQAASDTLRRLREEGPNLIHQVSQRQAPCSCNQCDFLRSIGVKPHGA